MYVSGGLYLLVMALPLFYFIIREWTQKATAKILKTIMNGCLTARTT